MSSPLDSMDSFYNWLNSVRDNIFTSLDLQQSLLSLKTIIPQQNQSQLLSHSLILSDQQIHPTSLEIRGDLILSGEQEALVVAGDLIVDGYICALGWDYSLIFVGGNLRCKGLLLNGELIVLGHLEALDILVGMGNDHSSVASSLKTPHYFLAENRTDYFSQIQNSNKIEEFTLSSESKKKISSLLHASKALNPFAAFLKSRGQDSE
jgi:hypothetical protein